MVELDDVKSEGVDSVEVKVRFFLWLKSFCVLSKWMQIEGVLKLNELGEAGGSTVQLVNDAKILWVKGPVSDQERPKTIDFRISLPTTFTYEGNTYVKSFLHFHVDNDSYHLSASPYLPRSKSS